MGLDSYKKKNENDKVSNSSPSDGAWGKKDSFINGGEVIRTLKGAKNAVKDAHDILGEEPTVKAFNELRDDIGTTTSAATFGDRVGKTFNEVKALSVVDNQELRKEEYCEWKVYRDFIKAAEEYGLSFTSDQFDTDERFTSVTYSKSVTGKTFNEIKSHLGLIENRPTLDTLNDISEDYTGKYEDVIDAQLDAIDVNSDADGHVYTLMCESANIDDTFYYIGSCESGRVYDRLVQHMKVGGHFSAITRIGGAGYIKPYNDVEFEDILIIDIMSFHIRDDESASEFKSRLRAEECVRRNEVAIDFDTTCVLGGT